MRKGSYSRAAVALRAACVLFCLGGHASAQTASPAAAQKFDEFGDVPLTDTAARLDNFANGLEAQPGARGFIIVYRGRRDLPGLSGRLLGWMKDYLIHSRGLAAGRIAGVDGGVSDCIRQELWIVPVGAAPTPRRDAYGNDFEDTDSPWKFDEAPPSTTENMGGGYSSNIFQSLEGFANALRRHPRARVRHCLLAVPGRRVGRGGRRRGEENAQARQPRSAGRGRQGDERHQGRAGE